MLEDKKTIIYTATFWVAVSLKNLHYEKITLIQVVDGTGNTMHWGVVFLPLMANIA